MATEFVREGNDRMVSTYYSVAEYLEAARRAHRATGLPIDQGNPYVGGITYAEAFDLGENGWPEELPTALSIAEEAIKLCAQETTAFAFLPTHDVTGCDVDIDRYLSGEPECMIEYPMTPVSKVGKVITLCVSLNTSSSISEDTVKTRGHILVALAIALDQLGHSLELWADISARSHGKNAKVYTTRVLIKAAGEALDAERMMFMLAHPAAYRLLHHTATRTAMPLATWRKAFHVRQEAGYSNAYPISPREDMEEGTIYTPCLRSNEDIPDAHIGLLNYLRELELIQD